MAKLRIPPPIEPIEDAGGPALIAARRRRSGQPLSAGLARVRLAQPACAVSCSAESGLVHAHLAWVLAAAAARGLDSAGERHWAGVSGAASGWSVISAPAACAALPARALRDRHQRADAGAGAPGRDVDRPARTGAARGPRRRRPAGRDPARRASRCTCPCRRTRAWRASRARSMSGRTIPVCWRTGRDGARSRRARCDA